MRNLALNSLRVTLESAAGMLGHQCPGNPNRLSLFDDRVGGCALGLIHLSEAPARSRSADIVASFCIARWKRESGAGGIGKPPKEYHHRPRRQIRTLAGSRIAGQARGSRRPWPRWVSHVERSSPV